MTLEYGLGFCFTDTSFLIATPVGLFFLTSTRFLNGVGCDFFQCTVCGFLSSLIFGEVLRPCHVIAFLLTTPFVSRLGLDTIFVVSASWFVTEYNPSGGISKGATVCSSYQSHKSR